VKWEGPKMLALFVQILKKKKKEVVTYIYTCGILQRLTRASLLQRRVYVRGSTIQRRKHTRATIPASTAS
jgi:hypothetical protein